MIVDVDTVNTGAHLDGVIAELTKLPRLRSSHPMDVALAIVSARDRLFREGWGDLSAVEAIDPLATRTDPPALAITWTSARTVAGRRLRDGRFRSPVDRLPARVADGYVRSFAPARVLGKRRVCVMFAASREEGYAMRAAIFGPLVDEGIELLLLESPFYGARRAEHQTSASVATVADHLLLNVGMIVEGRALVRSVVEEGADAVVVAGYSMGGAMAAVVGALEPAAIGVVACATGASSGPIFARDLLSLSIDFDALEADCEIGDAREKIRSLFSRVDAQLLSPPARVEASLLVGCARDGYVDPDEVMRLHRHWPGGSLRWLPAGHVSALFTERAALRHAIRTSFHELER